MIPTATVSIDFTKTLGPIKPMNAGNNGPKVPRGDQTSGNFETYKMLHIPYARLHDANFSSAYGAPHTVDVRAIFKDFSADPTDPASYDFVMTDIYLKSLELAGTEPFFRLGGTIEHNPRKWFTCVPPDFKKFAVICEHIIRHCTGEFANGLGMKITYWEVWNEADGDEDDSLNKRNWQGTAAQFREMFCLTVKHLKACFPELKIGGPAACTAVNPWLSFPWTELLFEEMLKQGVKLDFYSWHCYGYQPSYILNTIKTARAFMDSHGQEQAESILDEWNYIRGWKDEFVYSLEQMAGIKGALFALSVMLGAQKLPVDMLMYYDMRVQCGFNGLWSASTFDLQKPWYAFFMFDKLAQLGTETDSSSDCDAVQVVSAVNGKGRKAAVVSAYTDSDELSFRKFEIRLSGLTDENRERLTVRLLDEKTTCFEIPFTLKDDVITFSRTFKGLSGLLIEC